MVFVDVYNDMSNYNSNYDGGGYGCLEILIMFIRQLIIFLFVMLM